jgi:polysaccharide pyruvyl transferase WcaK-like protein
MTKKHTLGLAGFYGYGNFGDELFLDVFQQHLKDTYDLSVTYDSLTKPYFSIPATQRVEQLDGIIIGGGDIVQPWAMDERYFNSAYLEKPVFIVGVGVPIRAATNTKHAEKDWIIEKYKKFFTHKNVKFIHARDEQSANWIRSKLKPNVPVIEAPDIVCSLNLPPVEIDSSKRILGIVTRKRPNDIPDDYTELKNLATEAIKNGWKIRHIILGSGNVGKADFSNADDLEIPGKELIYSENLNKLMIAIGECNALASMKFHGTVVATMYGIPSIVLIPTNKNKNFMKRINLDMQVSKFDSAALSELFKNLPSHLNARDINALRYKTAELFCNLKSTIKESIDP